MKNNSDTGIFALDTIFGVMKEIQPSVKEPMAILHFKSKHTGYAGCGSSPVRLSVAKASVIDSRSRHGNDFEFWYELVEE